MMRTLDDWLSWQEQLHFSAIDLGLDRIRKVASRLEILTLPFPVITVAGTNGKGSTVAFLNAMLSAQGYKTGAYTTPHLTHYNERISVAQESVSDNAICQAFEKIDQARGGISLTYFEFGTLAAVLCFIDQSVDVAILEVGLGGRLDAVNLWNAEVALITTIDLDHTDWLGDNREAIGKEKAGIMRANQPVVCADLNPPKSIAATALDIGAELYQYNKHYKITQNEDSWQWQGWEHQYTDLPTPALEGEHQIRNAALAIAGLRCLKTLNVSKQSIENGLRHAFVTGRLQKLQSNPDILLDVAHNPQSAQQLAQYLEKNKIKGKTRAIFSILSDKDVDAVIYCMQSVIDEWHIIELDSPRAIPVDELALQINQLGMDTVITYNDFNEIFQNVKLVSSADDRVVIFGSFLVVSGIISVSSG